MKISIDGLDRFVVKTVSREDVLAALGAYIEQRNLRYALSLEDLSDEACAAYATDLGDGFIDYTAILQLMGFSEKSASE